MAAYLIAQIEVTDPAAYEGYKRLAEEAIATHGGRYIVRGGPVRTLEGDHDGRRIVILEFENASAVQAFYDGSAYTRAREARRGAAVFTSLLVEGI